MKWSLLFFVFVLNFSCLSIKGQGKTKLDTYELPPLFKSEWRQDRNGCLGLRCKYTDSISSNKLIIGMSKNTFFDIFGKPDDYGADRDILLYYLCAECDPKNNVLKKTDSSWMIFYFKEGKLEKCTLQIN